MRHGLLAALRVGLLLALPLSSGCAGPVYTTYDADYAGVFAPGEIFRNEGFPIGKLGVCGPMSAGVADVFVYAGYLAADLGPDCATALDKAGAENILFVAAVEKAADDPKSLRLEQDYNMLVLDLRTGDPIWRVDDAEGLRGARIRRSATLELAFRDMVQAFAKRYPPAPARVGPQEL